MLKRCRRTGPSSFAPGRPAAPSPGDDDLDVSRGRTPSSVSSGQLDDPLEHHRDHHQRLAVLVLDDACEALSGSNWRCRTTVEPSSIADREVGEAPRVEHRCRHVRRPAGCSGSRDSSAAAARCRPRCAARPSASRSCRRSGSRSALPLGRRGRRRRRRRISDSTVARRRGPSCHATPGAVGALQQRR